MTQKRLNIGILIDDLDKTFTASIVNGAQIAAKELDANLFLFPGKYINPEYQDKELTMYSYQYNTIFSYASIQQMDVLCVLLGVIGSTLDAQQKKNFMDSFGEIPCVSMCCEVEGHPSLCFDNATGFYEEIAHLIEEHHAQKIGYVGGPETNEDARDREAVFRQVLADYHIPFAEKQKVCGNFVPYCQKEIEELLDRNADLDAIVFANDYMARAGYAVLKKRGLQIGRDILVVGFDDENFAVSMDPPLTTVKANGIDMGYQSVMLGIEHLKTGKIRNDKVKSSVILRKSCGCMAPGGEQMWKRLQLDTVDSYEERKKQMLNYLFQGYITANDDNGIRKEFSELIDLISAAGIPDYSFEKQQKVICNAFQKLFAKKILLNTTMDRLFDILRLLQYILEKKVVNAGENAQIQLCDLFYFLYRAAAEQASAEKAKNWNEMIELNRRSNTFTRQMISFESGAEFSYKTAIERLRIMNITTSYIYIFEHPVVNKEKDQFQIPEYVYLKAYHRGEETVVVPPQEQQIPAKQIFNNPVTSRHKRTTRILAPLFFEEMQYGVLLCEMDPLYYSLLMPSISQLNTAIRTMFLLEEQKKIEEKLEGNLRVVMQNNEYLESIAKIDELSQIYNRRGFYDQIKRILENKDMQGKRAVLLYGDLDGLKKINDQYGHDSGDIAIRTIAEVMVDAFSNDGIVARFGGDEFAAMIMLSQTEFEQTLLPVFQHSKNAANARLHLPFTIDMSMGYTEFIITKNVELYKLLEIADEKLYLVKKAKKTLRTE